MGFRPDEGWEGQGQKQNQGALAFIDIIVLEGLRALDGPHARDRAVAWKGLH